MTRSSSNHDDETVRTPSDAKSEAKEPDKPLPQHQQSAEEIKWLAKMDERREANDANGYEEARRAWIAAAQKRGSVGD